MGRKAWEGLLKSRASLPGFILLLVRYHAKERVSGEVGKFGKSFAPLWAIATGSWRKSDRADVVSSIAQEVEVSQSMPRGGQWIDVGIICAGPACELRCKRGEVSCFWILVPANSFAWSYQSIPSWQLPIRGGQQLLEAWEGAVEDWSRAGWQLQRHCDMPCQCWDATSSRVGCLARPRSSRFAASLSQLHSSPHQPSSVLAHQLSSATRRGCSWDAPGMQRVFSNGLMCHPTNAPGLCVGSDHRCQSKPSAKSCVVDRQRGRDVQKFCTHTQGALARRRPTCLGRWCGYLASGTIEITGQPCCHDVLLQLQGLRACPG